MRSFKESHEFAALLLTVGCVLIYRGWNQFRRKRQIEDTPMSRIETAAQGLVEFEGFAWPLVQDSYLSNVGEAIVYRKFRIEKLVKSGKSSSKWRTVFQDETHSPFLVCDKSGYALVMPQQMNLSATERITNWGALRGELQSYYSGLMGVETARIGFLGSLFNPSMRIVESVILVGSPVYARGFWQSNFESKSISVNPRPGLLDFEKFRNATSLRRFDRNRNGTVSDAEVREGYYGVAVATGIKASAAEQILCAGVLSSDPLHGLFLADCHQAHLLQRLGRYHLLQLVGGIALVAAGCSILVHQFAN